MSVTGQPLHRILGFLFRRPPWHGPPVSPSRAETVARGDSGALTGATEACTDSAHDLAEWVISVIDFLVLDERPASLDEYVSKPTLARKAIDKVRVLEERAA